MTTLAELGSVRLSMIGDRPREVVRVDIWVVVVVDGGAKVLWRLTFPHLSEVRVYPETWGPTDLAM
ncbi:hypothetical protein [Nocardia sp. NPDC060249]|uniref:hypothetical protein n=1 Tax=Nocardia sp. NPDC060249 TaxID=3347082 RepID=UPI00365F62B4